ncbi:MAG: type II toxin-antitoxin system Phd/YefM family antitoxin [Deltaproteobacteria bacterium]|nr:type II toxin-antitoxin system Phd/YefM family antitoxin [Deltaproteobacteria bacterium]
MKTMSALEVRKKFGSVLDMVSKKRIPVTISRANRPLAVLVPAQDYQARNSGRESRLRLAAEQIVEWKKLHARKLKGIVAVKLLRKSREER